MPTQFCRPKRSEQSQIRSGCTALPLAAVCAERDVRLLVTVFKTSVMFNLRDSPELKVDELIYQGYLFKPSLQAEPDSWKLAGFAEPALTPGRAVWFGSAVCREDSALPGPRLSWLQMCKAHIWALC